MSFLNQAAKFGEEFLERLPKSTVGRVASPISLFNKEQFGKLSRMIDNQGFTKVVGEIGSDFFKGKTINRITDSGLEMVEATAEQQMRLASQRKLLYGGIAGLAALNAMNVNPGGLTDKVTNLAMLGGHYTVGKTLMDMGGKAKFAGIGYLGLTAYNTLLNPGDNPGPM